MKQTNDAGPRGEYHFHDAERMRFVVGASGLTRAFFAGGRGVGGWGRSRWVLLGLAGVAPDLARLIHARFPQIDLEWLKTGEVGGSPAPESAGGRSAAGKGPEETPAANKKSAPLRG